MIFLVFGADGFPLHLVSRSCFFWFWHQYPVLKQFLDKKELSTDELRLRRAEKKEQNADAMR